MAYAVPYVRDPTAVVGRRIGAYVIDALLHLLIIAAVLVPVAKGQLTDEHYASSGAAYDRCDAVNNADPGQTVGEGTRAAADRVCFPIGDTAYLMDAADLVAIALAGWGASFLAQLLDQVLLQGLTGASVGKHLVGLRVVREDGSLAGVGWNLLRAVLFAFVDGQCLVGLITMCVSKGHRRVGDMAASTFVVDKRDVGSPIVVPGMTPVWHAPAHAPGPWQSAPGAPWGIDPWHQPSAPPPAGPQPTNDGPHWDAERDTYITFDRAQGAWLQWDEHRRTWVPIST